MISSVDALLKRLRSEKMRVQRQNGCNWSGNAVSTCEMFMGLFASSFTNEVRKYNARNYYTLCYFN